MSMESKLQRNPNLDKILQAEYDEKQHQSDYINMLKFRSKLPAYGKKTEILQLIQNNQVVVISGETGKSQKIFINSNGRICKFCYILLLIIILKNL